MSEGRLLLIYYEKLYTIYVANMVGICFVSALYAPELYVAVVVA